MADAPWNARTGRRLVLALAGSAFFHVVLSGSLTQGLSSRTFSAVPLSGSAVRVRLVPREPEAPSAVLAAEDRPAHRKTTVAPTRRQAEIGAVAQSESVPAASDTGFDATDPTYYTARQLDVYPSLSSALDFRVPPGDAREIAGRVLLRVDVSATGAVDAVTIVEAEPAGYFEEDARRAFAVAQFRPALKNGRPVKSRILVLVDYAKPDAASP